MKVKFDPLEQAMHTVVGDGEQIMLYVWMMMMLSVCIYMKRKNMCSPYARRRTRWLRHGYQLRRNTIRDKQWQCV